jgi:hypothetical protein
MNMRKIIVLLAVLIAIGGAVSGKSKQGKIGVNITLDEAGLKGKSDSVTAAWMGYGMARANWLSDHVIGKANHPLTYRRTFEEEFTGRETLVKIWSELKESDATLKDAYLDQLVAIQAAGFLAEYVWSYLGSSDWTQVPEQLHLDAFEKWKASNLVGHKPETFAEVKIEQKTK